jgi:hypothetical protein
MNKAYDYSGTLVSKSSPETQLTTVKRTVYIDSGDRDTTIYPTNGSYTVYLPRVYDRVVSISVKSAEFPLITDARQFIASTGLTGSALPATTLYFLLEIEGLNRSDETAVGGNRSAFTDSVFGKFQIYDPTLPVIYTESSGQQIIQRYLPPLGRIDRLKISTRLHTQPRGDTIFWPRQYGLALEIETMENSFDNFSSMETRLGSRS